MKNTGRLVLVVEDEADLANLLARRLEKAGYRVLVAGDGAAALQLANHERPDLLLLDRMLPVFDGIEVCRRLRATAHGREMAILFLSARGEVEDRITGLESGADDYLPKPFVMEEMLARVKALLRRPASGADNEAIIAGPFTATPATQQLVWRSKTMFLGRISFALLAHMMKRPNHIYSRAQLLDAVWGDHAILEERTVDVHIGRLRRTLVEAGVPVPVKTMRGLGYAFRLSEEA